MCEMNAVKIFQIYTVHSISNEEDDNERRWRRSVQISKTDYDE